VYREIVERGPLAAGELSKAGKSTGPWWGWSEGKLAMEVLFRQGRVAVARRRNFERIYDITDRVIPAAVLNGPAVTREEAQKALLVRAARAMGVGTAKDIAQYFHIDTWWDRQFVGGRRKPRGTAVLFGELVEAERLTRLRVEGWKDPAFTVPGATVPRTIDVRAIVSPFDPVLWERKWTHAVFGFPYQIEIYVPAAKRVHGYYVLPFLMGDGFGARVDLKADRRASTLLVHAAYVEPGVEAGATAAALAGELRALMRWLSLENVAVARKGSLSSRLAKELRHA
jgi:uncharacterized protein YcaQ